MWWGEGVIQTQPALEAVKTHVETVARFQYSVKKRDIHNVGVPSFSAVRSDVASVWSIEHSTSVLDHVHHHIIM